MKTREWTFIIILHRFLLFYLAVHQFFIPLTRLLSGVSLSEAHFGLTFWLHLFFHFQITKKDHLSSKERLASPTLSFVAAFSFFKLLGTFLIQPIDEFTYGHLSALLTEGSSLLFLGIYASYGVPSFKSLRRVSGLLAGGLLALIPLLTPFFHISDSGMEPQKVVQSSQEQANQRKSSENKNFKTCGAQSFELSASSRPTKTAVSKLEDCGLEPTFRQFEDVIEIENNTKTTSHVRLFSIENPRENPKPQYKGILILEPSSRHRFDPSWTQSGELFLVKSEAHPEMGIQVLVKKDFVLGNELILSIEQDGSIERRKRP